MFLILSPARHGSTLTTRLLNNFDEIEIYNKFNEFYTRHTKKVLNIYQLKRFKKFINDMPNDIDRVSNDLCLFNSKELTNFCLEHPIDFLKIMNEYKNSQYICFKLLFHQIDHMTFEKFKYLISELKIFPLIIYRKPIDAYISERKFKTKSLRAENIDTTNYLINLDAKNFFEYFKKHKRKYHEITNLFNFLNIDYCFINYDLDLKNQSELRMLKLLKKRIYNHFSIYVNYDKNNTMLDVFKQDRSKFYKDSINNWNEFLNNCKKMGIEDKLWSYF